MGISEEKTALRSITSARIATMSDEERRRKSDDLCRKILALLPPGTFEICGYMPMGDEADILPILHEALRRKCALYLPRYAKNTLAFHAVSSLEEELHPGHAGIREPHPHLPPLDPASLRFALVPGRAFDLAGHRVGRGKGAYDAWIARQRAANPLTQFLGIAFGCQIFPQVPEDAHDQRMDRVIASDD